MWGGIVRYGSGQMFKKSSEKQVTIHKLPTQKIVANKKFEKGQLKLCAMTSGISITKVKDIKDKPMVLLENCFEHGGQIYAAIATKRVVFPSEKAVTGTLKRGVEAETFLVAYWLCEESFDESKANAEKVTIEYTFKIAGDSITLQIPHVVNTTRIEAGESVIVKKIGHDPLQRDAKRQKLTRHQVPSSTEPASSRDDTDGKGKGCKGGKKVTGKGKGK